MGIIDWLIAIALSAAPVSELRGGLPFALARGAHPALAYIVAVCANLLVVPLLLVGLGKLEEVLRRRPILGKGLDSLLRLTQRKARWVRRVGPVALVLLVAVPAPGTGAWTGAIVAFLVGLPLRRAFSLIAIGVAIAGMLVLLASFGMFSLFGIR